MDRHGIGVRKEGTVRNYYRCVLSKSSIHSYTMRGKKQTKSSPSTMKWRARVYMQSRSVPQVIKTESANM
jgi:hypothetical protein